MTGETKDKPSGSAKPDTPPDRMSEDIERALAAVLRDRPQLRALREASRGDSAPQDKFAREFLRAFRQRMQG